jgi:hypothetical protein
MSEAQLHPPGSLECGPILWAHPRMRDVLAPPRVIWWPPHAWQLSVHACCRQPRVISSLDRAGTAQATERGPYLVAQRQCRRLT